ncbi:hypothetical protein RF11_13761 [Thelohanellus kitauei]|uniref:Uncharacterized protein n=1 Tax=Thelohanellus kitauei TaxID=669202 RepID=A0A0C2M3M9_THEKT|nr:hypothetical protein RF11_13761 [Thelohanellus kitauei]
MILAGEDCENTAVEESGVVTIIFRVERSSLATKWHNSSTEKSLTEGESRELQCPEDCLVWRYDHPLKSPPLYFVHSPKFPILKKEGWWAYVLTSAEKFITAPIYFHFTKNTEFLKFQFQAPSFIGVSRYKCVIMSDSYLGFQFQQEITVFLLFIGSNH